LARHWLSAEERFVDNPANRCCPTNGSAPGRPDAAARSRRSSPGRPGERRARNVANFIAVEPTGATRGGPVVPHHEIDGAPFMAINELRLYGVLRPKGFDGFMATFPVWRSGIEANLHFSLYRSTMLAQTVLRH
jgi:hypothetical protein